MKVKVGQIVASFQSGALTRLAQAAMPMSTALRFKSVLKDTQEILQTYDENRVKLCAEFGTLNEETQNYDIVPEKMADFQEVSGGLLQEEVDVAGDTFSSGSFLSSQTIAPNDLLILDWLIQTESNVLPMPKKGKKRAIAKGA